MLNRINSMMEARFMETVRKRSSDLIRREQERSFEIDTIRQALIEGEQSGAPQPFDFDAFLQRMNAVRRLPRP